MEDEGLRMEGGWLIHCAWGCGVGGEGDAGMAEVGRYMGGSLYMALLGMMVNAWRLSDAPRLREFNVRAESARFGPSPHRSLALLVSL